MAQTKRGRGRPQDTRLGEDLAALFLLSRDGAQTSVGALAQQLQVTHERAGELLRALISTGDDTSGETSTPLVPLSIVGRDTLRRTDSTSDASGVPRTLRLTAPEAEAVADALDQLGLDEKSSLRTFVERDLFPVGYVRERPKKAEIERGVWPQLELCARSLARAKADADDTTYVHQPVITFKYRGDNDLDKVRTRFAVPRALRLSEEHWVTDAYDIQANGVRTFLLFRMENAAFSQEPGMQTRCVPVRTEKKGGRYVRLTCTSSVAQRVLAWEGARQLGSSDERDEVVIEVPYYRADWLPRHLMALGRSVSWDDAELDESVRDIANEDLTRARRLSSKKEGTS